MLKEMLNDLLDKWEQKAKETATPLDDAVIRIIKTLVDLLI